MLFSRFSANILIFDWEKWESAKHWQTVQWGKLGAFWIMFFTIWKVFTKTSQDFLIVKLKHCVPANEFLPKNLSDFNFCGLTNNPKTSPELQHKFPSDFFYFLYFLSSIIWLNLLKHLYFRAMNWPNDVRIYLLELFLWMCPLTGKSLSEALLFVYKNFSTQHVLSPGLSMEFVCNSMNNLSSYRLWVT